jgi:hypothetical protein
MTTNMHKWENWLPGVAILASPPGEFPCAALQQERHIPVMPA